VYLRDFNISDGYAMSWQENKMRYQHDTLARCG